MINLVNYANSLYYDAQKLNTRTAYKFGVDKVYEYSFETLPKEFVEEHAEHFKHALGNGYWIWKPYIILDVLSKINYGDYLIYLDAGAAVVNSIKLLIDAMEAEGTDVMGFAITQREKCWSKRDAFIIMDCDNEEVTESAQICGGYIVIKKTEHSVNVVQKYYEYCKDFRIVSDEPSTLGKDYEGFVEGRHDQTVWSLLLKKEGIKPFRDPSEFGLNYNEFDPQILARSNYPQIVESHRSKNIRYSFELEYVRKKHPVTRVAWYIFRVCRKVRRVFCGLLGTLIIV